jgi:hypothetical protein
LLDCLNLERENLIHVNVKGLWSAMEEKKKILASIQETDQEISGCGPGSEMEIRSRQAVRTFNQEIRRLKQEIGARVRENVSFIEETLRFFDEIVSIFAGGGGEQYSYEAVPRTKISSSLIYRSEV